MHPAIPHLIELQRVDHQIAVLRAELEAFPKRIREAETKLGGARADVASAKEAHALVVAERKKFEFDAQQWKDRARKYRDQSGAVKTNEAFKALQHEIANAEAEVAKADDRQLEVMMAAEEVQRRTRKNHRSRPGRFARALRAYRQAPQRHGHGRSSRRAVPRLWHARAAAYSSGAALGNQ